MKKFFPLIIFIIAICAGCGNSEGYQRLSADKAREIIKTEKDIIILDVRTVAEYEKQHIPNAILLPIEELHKNHFTPLPDKNQKILIYCWTGRRAEDSAKILVKHGYINVFEFGGLVDWEGELESTDVK